MVWAVVIAFIAAAIAIGLAVAGLRRIYEVEHRLRGELTEGVQRGADQAGDVATKKVDMALRQLEISQKNYEEAAGKQRRHTGLLYLSADADVTKAGSLATELASYIVRTLDHQAATESAPLTVRGGLYSGHPAVLDVVPGLIEKFIHAIGAELLYSQDDGSQGRRWFMRWPADSDEPGSVMRSLLATATAGGASEPAHAADEPESAQAAADDGASEPTHAADDTAALVAGAAELTALLDAVPDGHPLGLHVGRLVVEHTEARLAAGIAPRGWTGFIKDQQLTAITGIGASLLTRIGATDIVDLSR